MPTMAEVIDAFKKDKVVDIVSRFYDNVINSKKPNVPNHYGTDDFCQFVKYATLNQSIIKRALHENDIRKTELKGELGENLVQITEWVDVPGLLFGTLGGFSMELNRLLKYLPTTGKAALSMAFYPLVASEKWLVSRSMRSNFCHGHHQNSISAAC